MREGHGALDTRRDVAREANVGTERFGRSFFYPSSDDEESCPMIGHDCIVRTFSRMPHPPGGRYESFGEPVPHSIAASPCVVARNWTLCSEQRSWPPKLQQGGVG